MGKFLKALLMAVLVLVGTVPVDAGIIRSYKKNGIMYHEWVEDDGFRWISMRDIEHHIGGAQTQSGTTIIPLSRHYYFICYIPVANHPDAGYFSVYSEGFHFNGAVDIHGREIIAPNKYKSVRFESDRGYLGQKEGSVEWEDIALSSANSSTYVSSTTPSNSYASTTSNSDNLTYLYTVSGRGQSQNTGQWTDAIPSRECTVQFKEDRITVDGLDQPYVRTSGTWKVYGGISWGGLGMTTYYYVDGNKNMKQVSEYSSQYGFDTYVYPMSRNGDPTPMGNNGSNGGYVNDNGTNNSYGTGSATQSSRTYKCAYCNGTGRIGRNDNAPASFGQTRANKKCAECGKVYDPTVFNHYHVQCGHCGGTGRMK